MGRFSVRIPYHSVEHAGISAGADSPSRREAGALWSWLPVLAIVLCGCSLTFLVDPLPYSIRPEERDKAKVRLRLFQLKKYFNGIKDQVSIYDFLSSQGAPKALDDYLASDQDNSEKHLQAYREFEVSVRNSDELELRPPFSRLKDAEYLLVVSPSQNPGTHWFDQQELPPRWKFWHQSVTICVDPPDVFIDCRHMDIRIVGTPVHPFPLNIQIYQLKTSLLPHFGWKDFLDQEPPELRHLLASTTDPSLRLQEVLYEEEKTLRSRLVPGARHLLVVLSSANKTWGAQQLIPLDETSNGASATIDLSHFR
jgi:hypothetical protein